MTRYFLAFLMCSTLLSAPHTAQAAIDAAGAETVKTILKSMVEDQIVQAVKRQSPFAHIKMAGDYVVVPKDTFYAVTFPHMIIDVHKSHDKGSTESDLAFTIDYGSISMNIMPGPIDHQWRMAAALPSPIRFKMASDLDCRSGKKCEKGKTTTQPALKEINIYQTTKRAQILWDDIKKTALKTDILIDDIQIKYDGKPVPLTFGSLASTTNVAETSPGIFTGTSNVSLKNIALDMSDVLCPAPCKNPGTIKIGEFFGAGTYTGYDYKMAKTFNEKMSAMMEAGYNPAKPTTPESFAALWKEIMTYGFSQVDNVDGKIGFHDLAVNIKPTHPTEKPVVFSLKELTYGGGISNWKSDKSNINLSISIDGMTVAAETIGSALFKLFSPYIPTTAHEKINIINFPHKKLMEQLGAMGQNFMASMGPEKCEPNEKPEQCAKRSKNTQQTQMLGLQAMMTMPQLFAETGTKVAVHVDGDAPKLTALIDGDFTANATAMYSGVGKLKAVLGGIDALIADMQTASKDPATSPADAKQLQEALAGLTGLQLFGQQGADAKGNPARIFDMTLDDQGAIKLNGADLSTFRKGTTPAGSDQKSLPSITTAPPATGKP